MPVLAAKPVPFPVTFESPIRIVAPAPPVMMPKLLADNPHGGFRLGEARDT